jgi:hypothetical protein
VNNKEQAMFLVYNKKTTVVMRARQYGLTIYATQSAAKAFLTRMVKQGYRREDFAVTDAPNYYANIEKSRVVRNLMTGANSTESVNTPNCCSVGSETYWSM